MKSILLILLLATTFCLTGCETTVVDRRPVAVHNRYHDRDYGYRDNGYQDNRDVRVVNHYDGYGNRGDRYDDRRDVRVVRTNNNYYRPAPVVNRTVVVRNQPERYNSQSRTVVHTNQVHQSTQHNDKKKKKDKDEGDNDGH